MLSALRGRCAAHVRHVLPSQRCIATGVNLPQSLFVALNLVSFDDKELRQGNLLLCVLTTRLQTATVTAMFPAAFDRADLDGNGVLSRDEIAAVLEGVCGDHCEETLEFVMKEFDHNKASSNTRHETVVDSHVARTG